MKKIIFTLFVAWFVSACGSMPQLTPDAKLVQTVEVDPQDCNYVGEMATYTPMFKYSVDVFDIKTRIEQTCDIQVKNSAASVGGNTVVRVLHGEQADLMFDAYTFYQCG
jgi:3-deoxy-D-manno-octulosonate 8-phosphate phosphatase KdsC-like HAD superfamily phosphatase